MARKAKQEPKSQSCEAWLVIGPHSYEGKTGKDQGHAEMSALDCFISYFDTVGAAVTHFRAAQNRGVFCPSRDVCKQCGYVLKGLGFGAISNANGNTVWGSQTMGSTEWGCTLKVRDFLAAMNVDYQAAVGLRQ
jgi:hypothetical protein